MDQFEAQQLALMQRQRRFQDQQMPNMPGPGQMVGGHFIATNPLSYLAEAVRVAGARQGEKNTTQELQALQGQRRQAIADALRGFQTEAAGAPAFQATGPAPEGQDQSGGYTVPGRAPNLKGAYQSLLNAPTPALQELGIKGVMTQAQTDAARAQNQQYFDILSKVKDPQQALQAGVPFEMVEQFYKSPNLGRNKVGRTIEVEGPNGQKMIQQLDEFGSPVGPAVPGYMAPQAVNQGNRVTFAKPIAGQSFDVNMAPGEVARLNQAERHHQANLGAPQFSAEAGGFVYKPTVQNPQGGFVPAQGMPAKPLNDVQAKAVAFGTRMQNADSILNDLAKSGVNAVIPGSGNAVVNPLLSKNQQMAVQAQRDFVNAVLRRESGAAISPTEFDNASKQYFPQVGDSPEVRQQKAQNRAIAIQGILAEIPQSHKGLPNQIIQSTKPQSNSLDALLEKYK